EREKKETRVPWIPLGSIDQLDEIAEKSMTKSQLIFKHSTTCGISRMVLNMFTNSYSLESAIDLYFLDLHAHREVSNAVQHKFQVIHQSPQLLIIKNGQVVYHTSHGAIAETDLALYV
ncbi:MAG: bacillithiol system redox-active protein YtxJ, partial [Flavobacteriaceae bacterium]